MLLRLVGSDTTLPDGGNGAVTGLHFQQEGVGICKKMIIFVGTNGKRCRRRTHEKNGIQQSTNRNT